MDFNIGSIGIERGSSSNSRGPLSFPVFLFGAICGLYISKFNKYPRWSSCVDWSIVSREHEDIVFESRDQFQMEIPGVGSREPSNEGHWWIRVCGENHLNWNFSFPFCIWFLLFMMGDFWLFRIFYAWYILLHDKGVRLSSRVLSDFWRILFSLIYESNVDDDNVIQRKLVTILPI